MSEQNIGDSAPRLENAGLAPPGLSSYRNTVPIPPIGHTHSVVPTLPPRPEFLSGQNYGANQYSYGMGTGGMGSYGMTGMGSYGMGGMGGYGGYSGGYGGYSGGYGGMGGMGMGMNSFGMAGQNYGYGNIESRFIQIAEENSRPAFESIQSLVYAVGGVSMMLENTFFALTSSFRAILGVAENFGRLRSLFAQFWTTFGMIRSINWLFRKLSVMIGIRTEAEFKAWAEAVAATQVGTATAEQRARGSTWPVLLFFGLIAAAPYILLKMMSGITTEAEALDAARAKQMENYARQEAHRAAARGRCSHGRVMRALAIVADPKTWKNALRAVAQHNHQAASSQELSFSKDQVLKVAPQSLQGQLWNSGWLLATADGTTTGLVPVNHIKIIVPAEANAGRNPMQGDDRAGRLPAEGNASGDAPGEADTKPDEVHCSLST